MRARARCTFSKEALALHVESDLPDAAARTTARHLEMCEECRAFFEELRVAQSLLKSLRHEVVGPSECTEMRRGVMSMIDARLDAPGWALRVERAVVLGVRQRAYALVLGVGQRAYALAVVALIAIVSVSGLAQMRSASSGAGTIAAPARRTPPAAEVSSRRSSDAKAPGVRKVHDVWFLDFSGLEATLKAKLQTLPDSSGCRMCHPHT